MLGRYTIKEFSIMSKIQKHKNEIKFNESLIEDHKKEIKQLEFENRLKLEMINKLNQNLLDIKKEDKI